MSHLQAVTTWRDMVTSTGAQQGRGLAPAHSVALAERKWGYGSRGCNVSKLQAAEREYSEVGKSLESNSK